MQQRPADAHDADHALLMLIMLAAGALQHGSVDAHVLVHVFLPVMLATFSVSPGALVLGQHLSLK